MPQKASPQWLLILTFVAFAGIVLTPIDQLNHPNLVQAPFDLPSTVSAGELIIIPENQGELFEFQREALSHIPHKNVYIKAAGFYRSHQFTGDYKTPDGWFWFNAKVHVDVPEPSKAQLLRLPASTTSRLAQIEPARRSHEYQVVKRILAQKSKTPMSLCHQRPVKGIEMSPFGRPRVLASGSFYHHSGADLRARTGDPIHTSGKGTIVLSDWRGVSGKTVIVDHGNGLFSKYFHMSRLLVKKGDTVQAGQLLGLAGATGRVTGPHLHWEMTLNKLPLNPLLFLKQSQSLCPPTKVSTLKPPTTL